MVFLIYKEQEDNVENSIYMCVNRFFNRKLKTTESFLANYKQILVLSISHSALNNAKNHFLSKKVGDSN